MEAMYDPFLRRGASRALDFAHGSIKRSNRKSSGKSDRKSNSGNGSNRSSVQDSAGEERGVAAPSKAGG